jgi:hypothetical protein
MASQHEAGKSTASKQPFKLVKRTNLRPVLEIHWSDLSPDSIRGAVDAVTRAGAAILMGRTSDGGALSICILDGDSKIKEYPHTVEEATQLLAAILEEYSGV